MPAPNNLALEVYTIEIFHVIALIITFGFTFYFSLKAKKTPLFYSFLGVVGTLCIWMISKVLKTLSPNEHLRWFFIVTQYLGIQFSGFSVILFAQCIKHQKLPRFRWIFSLSLLPLIGFLIVATNPLHHLFYSYYDLYQDSFGPLFYPIASLQYIYLFTGIYMLSRGFTRQRQFKNRKILARFFAILILISISGNIYYLLVKLTDVPFIFPFPFFDFTPITSIIALILFVIPAYKYRFLDILPLAYVEIFNHMPEGISFIHQKKYLHSYNKAFQQMFDVTQDVILITEFIPSLGFINPQDSTLFEDFLLSSPTNETFLLQLKNNQFYKVHFGITKKKQSILFFTDISAQVSLKMGLQTQNLSLNKKNRQLQSLVANTRELSITRTQTKIAQDVHDILGHSITVVIGISDLACMDSDLKTSKSRIAQIKELLFSGVSDLKSSLSGQHLESKNASLIKAIHSLKNDTIHLDFTVQGKSYELSSKHTEAIFRCCQEAMTNGIKHGMAKNLHITLRYKPNEIEVYIIDDGKGCSHIVKNVGLKGIESRLLALQGQITFDSDGEKGFHIHMTIPT